MENKPLLWIAAAAACIFGAACSNTPKGVIPQHEMAELVADIHQGEGVIDIEVVQFGKDSMKMELREAIYRRHGVTREQVDSSFVWYGRNIEKYVEVYDEAIDILEKRLADANSLSATGDGGYGPGNTVSLEGDSVDVWTGSPHRRLYHQSGQGYITYRVSRDNKWEEGDTYTLNLKLINPQRPVDATILVEYSDGTEDYRTASFRTNGWSRLGISLDEKRTARSVGVAIGYTPEPDEVLYIDSISLVRQHRRYTAPTAAQRRTEIENFNQDAPVSGSDSDN